MRGLQSIRTGQRAIEGVELARAVQQGYSAMPGTPPVADPDARARTVARTFDWLADSPLGAWIGWLTLGLGLWFPWTLGRMLGGSTSRSTKVR